MPDRGVSLHREFYQRKEKRREQRNPFFRGESVIGFDEAGRVVNGLARLKLPSDCYLGASAAC